MFAINVKKNHAIFKNLLKLNPPEYRHKIKLSMSGIGHCYDNAVAESFFHTLKTEHTNFYIPIPLQELIFDNAKAPALERS